MGGFVVLLVLGLFLLVDMWLTPERW